MSLVSLFCFVELVVAATMMVSLRFAHRTKVVAITKVVSPTKSVKGFAVVQARRRRVEPDVVTARLGG